MKCDFYDNTSVFEQIFGRSIKIFRHTVFSSRILLPKRLRGTIMVGSLVDTYLDTIKIPPKHRIFHDFLDFPHWYVD